MFGKAQLNEHICGGEPTEIFRSLGEIVHSSSSQTRQYVGQRERE